MRIFSDCKGVLTRRFLPQAEIDGMGFAMLERIAKCREQSIKRSYS